MAKTCGTCSIYQPSRYEPVQGAGMCGLLVEWYAKHKARGTIPRPASHGRPGELEMVYKSMGVTHGTANAVARPDAVRDNCTKFVRKSM